MNEKAAFEEIDLDVLRRWVETRKEEVMPEELAVYLTQLEMVNGWHTTMMLENEIVNSLILHYPNLSRYRASNIYYDAINYFYLDKTISQEAWANVYAERFDKLALAMLKSAQTPDELHKVKDVWREAALLRKSYEDSKDEIPAEFYEKRVVLYTQKLKDVGMPEISRHEIARMIDGLPLTESEALDIKRDGSIEQQVLFAPNEQKTKD